MHKILTLHLFRNMVDLQVSDKNLELRGQAYPGIRCRNDIYEEFSTTNNYILKCNVSQRNKNSLVHRVSTSFILVPVRRAFFLADQWTQSVSINPDAKQVFKIALSTLYICIIQITL